MSQRCVGAGAAFGFDDGPGLGHRRCVDVHQEAPTAPWRASRIAVALPLPQILLPAGPTDPAPVTIATFPAMLSILVSSQAKAFR